VPDKRTTTCTPATPQTFASPSSPRGPTWAHKLYLHMHALLSTTCYRDRNVGDVQKKTPKSNKQSCHRMLRNTSMAWGTAAGGWKRRREPWPNRNDNGVAAYSGYCSSSPAGPCLCTGTYHSSEDGLRNRPLIHRSIFPAVSLVNAGKSPPV
jgi:hypothetical protein